MAKSVTRASITGPAGATGPAGTAALWSWKGAWGSETNYIIGDVVTFSGQTYYCIAAVNGYQPYYDSFWTLIAAKGETGATGPSTGAAGGDLTGNYPDPTIGSGKVTSTHILDGTIVNADINSAAAIALSKLATDPLARANHTGTQTASTISDFDTQVRTSRLDQMAAPTAAVSMGSQKIASVGTPSAGTDAANKTYVDTAVGVVSASAAAAPTRALLLFFA